MKLITVHDFGFRFWVINTQESFSWYLCGEAVFLYRWLDPVNHLNKIFKDPMLNVLTQVTATGCMGQLYLQGLHITLEIYNIL